MREKRKKIIKDEARWNSRKVVKTGTRESRGDEAIPGELINMIKKKKVVINRAR